MPASIIKISAGKPETARRTPPEPKTAIGTTSSSAAVAGTEPPVVVKKYANRRLYNTESSSYITLDNLAEMVRTGRDFVVYDARTGEDITRGVLTQIIVDEESKGRAMLPTGFLRQLIGFYGNSMQGLVPDYLEKAMEAFAEQQEKVRVTVQETVGTLFPGIEEVRRQNMAMMERAMAMFAPFYHPPETPALGGEADPERELAILRAEVEALRKALADTGTKTIKPSKD